MLRMLADIPFDSILGRVVRAPLKLIPSGTIVRIRRGPLKGMKWIVGASTNGCWLGTFEVEKVAAFAGEISPASVVYDLGANTGIYTLLASRRAPQGHVYSFEPFPRNVEFLARHLALNRITNCTVIEAAVGAASGWASFAAGAKPEMGSVDPGGDLRVKMVSLDELRQTASLPRPDLIKMDIEGGELEALRGASKLLREDRPVLYVATHSPQLERECREILTGMDYRIELCAGSTLEWIARPA
jgi:FkbM family methyltransferase